jgi:site-specific DNA-methyltransferase (adenine-specific)
MGFEVRDCIFLADSPTDKIHYVAKAPVAEREAGLDHLPETSGEVLEAVDVEDEDEDAGTKKKAKKKRLNTHPTVKPVRLMERLLADVPKGAGPVVDPFLGSGTTGIAALKTGHDFIGVEQEAAYFAIAQARIEHTRRKKGGGGA